MYNKRSNYPLGIDISDLSIKMIQLSKTGKKTEITAAGKINIEPGIIENGEIKNMRAASEAIDKLINKPQFGSIGTTNAIVSLPDTKTFIKLIEVEKTANNLESLIPTEIEKYIPIPINEICYDWQIIEKNTNTYSVLVGATPMTIVNQYIELLERSKFSPIATEIESMSICRALLKEEGLKQNKDLNLNYCIIDIGLKRSSITVYSHNTIVTSVSLSIAGNNITEKISQSLDIDIEQAEKAKIICGLDQTKAKGIVSDLLKETIEELINRIDNVIKFFYKHYPEREKINKIILCGGGSNIKNLKNIINKKLSIETIEGSIFNNIDAPNKKINDFFTEIHKTDNNGKPDKNQALKQSSSLSYATATGLALRGLQIEI